MSNTEATSSLPLTSLFCLTHHERIEWVRAPDPDRTGQPESVQRIPRDMYALANAQHGWDLGSSGRRVNVWLDRSVRVEFVAIAEGNASPEHIASKFLQHQPA